MGWTTYDTDKAPSDKAGELTIIKAAIAPDKIIKALKVGAVWYTAVKIEDNKRMYEAGGSPVSCVLFLTNRVNGKWGYRMVLETDGPAENKCPESILRILSKLSDDTRNVPGQEWRQRCEDYHARPKPNVGDTVKFDTPLSFGDEGFGSIFKKVNLPGYKSVYECLDNPALGQVRLQSDQLADATLTRK